MTPTDLARRLTAFFSAYLSGQRDLSPNTILAYRDTFVLLLRYCREFRGLAIERLCLEQIDAPLVLDFLGHLVRHRGCSANTRNHRLSALHSFFSYVQTEEPERLLQCQRVLAIPCQRIPRTEPVYLRAEHLRCILDQPDLTTRNGRRDAVLFSLLYDTAARVQEVIDLAVRDVRLGAPAQVRITGKGRKIRMVPLMSGTVEILRDYMKERGLDAPACHEKPLFTNRMGQRFSRWGIRYLLNKYTTTARQVEQSIPEKVTPHTLRHTKAMHLLQSGNPLVVIRDLLGHATVQSTEIYARADLEMKRRALERATGALSPRGQSAWKEDTGLLAWLRSL